METSKRWRLYQLAEKRRQTDLSEYVGTDPRHRHIGEFGRGIFDCEHVSPWTLSASNVDADYMIVGQDWSSADQLEKEPKRFMVDQGYDPSFPTNRNLNELLEQHCGMTRRECYLTNLFPFIKAGDASTKVPMAHLEKCAQDFLIPQIDIVAPRAVICLGFDTIKALRTALKKPLVDSFDSAIAESFSFGKSAVFAVAHTGFSGMNNRGKDQVRRDWRRIARCMSGAVTE